MCGLTFFISKDNKFIDINKFKFAMKLIEDRGKQSVGITNGDIFNKALGDVDNFIKNVNWESFSDSRILLGHNRAPSIGTDRSINSTQPFSYKDIVIAHNGTIDNMEKIADYYNVNFDKNDTDTMILGKILLDLKNVDVLNYIDGAATIIWFYKSKPNEAYVFRSNVNNDTRPLFAIDTKEGLYFSSTKDTLELMANTNDEFNNISPVNLDMVYKITNGVIDKKGYFEPSYDNSLHDVVVTSSFYSNKYNSYSNKTSSNHTSSSNESLADKEFKDLETIDRVYDLNSPQIVLTSSTSHDYHEEELNMSKRPINHLVYYKGLYRCNDIVCDGIQTYDKEYKRIYAPDKSVESETFYFIQGILVNNLTAFNIINNSNYKIGEYLFYENIKNYTNQPVPVNKYSKISWMNKSVDVTYLYRCIGVDSRYYELNNGDLIDVFRYLAKDIKISDFITLYSDDELHKVISVNASDNKVAAININDDELNIYDYNIKYRYPYSDVLNNKFKGLDNSENVSRTEFDTSGDIKQDDTNTVGDVFDTVTGDISYALEELNDILNTDSAVKLTAVLKATLNGLSKLNITKK